MSELYLIAHKVRGEPAFDIAIKVQIGDGEGWVIPTSGHRAYPYWEMSFSQMETVQSGCIFAMCPDEPPPDWPDHYPAPSEAKQTGADLLKELGLTVRDWPMREFKRRI